MIEIHELLHPMDPVSVPTSAVEEDEWDADGFEIPCLKLGKSSSAKKDTPGAKEAKPSSQQVNSIDEKIYLGPHGAPPSQVKQQELNAAGKKQRFKHKLKEADKKSTVVGHENKIENLRDLIGGKGSLATPRGSPREWLDPHCHESQFERSA